MADESWNDVFLKTYNLGLPVTPFQKENSPWDALMVGAGRGFQSGINQVEGAYNVLRGSIADKWQGKAAGDVFRAKQSAARQRQLDESELFAPMREAYPYTTAIGSSAPAFMTGPVTGMSNLHYNVGSAYANDVVNHLLKVDPHNPTLQRIAQALRGL